MISVQGLQCKIGDRTIVEDVSFTFGNSCAIVGGNGVGKTTLLRTLAGLTAPARGRVVMAEQDIHALRPQQRARLLSFVGQEETLDGDVTVEEAVSLGRLPFMKPWQRHVDVTWALEKVGIVGMKDRRCSELSGGQRRLVLLARMIAQDTPYVLLDEPTNHLDIRHQLDVLDIVSAMNRQVIATVHDLDRAMSHFDSTVLLHEGRVLAAGPSEAVLTPENIKRAFGVTAIVVKPEGVRSAHLIFEG